MLGSLWVFSALLNMFLSWICYPFHGLSTNFLIINSSLFPVKNCNEATLLFSATALKLQFACLKCRWVCVASILKLHQFPLTAAPVRFYNISHSIQTFYFQVLKHGLNLTKILCFSDSTALCSLKIIVYIPVLSSNSDTVAGSGGLRL